jgi:hypothetical protein
MEVLKNHSSFISAAIPNERVECFVKDLKESGLTPATVRSDSPYGKSINLTPGTTWVVAETTEQH